MRWVGGAETLCNQYPHPRVGDHKWEDNHNGGGSP